MAHIFLLHALGLGLLKVLSYVLQELLEVAALTVDAHDHLSQTFPEDLDSFSKAILTLVLKLEIVLLLDCLLVGSLLHDPAGL